MNWQEVIESPDLRDLPYRIELNSLGQILMSPASNEHSFRQSRIIRELLQRAKDGEVLPECSIDTVEGTKVADVVWFSDQFYSAHGLATPFPKAPEICVEILSPSNTSDEMNRKRSLYFAQEAREVWLCEPDGGMKFFTEEGKIGRSQIFEDFPTSI